MKKEKPPVTYDTRYRYKLDMLEPGTIMLKWVGIFLLIGLALELAALEARRSDRVRVFRRAVCHAGLPVFRGKARADAVRRVPGDDAARQKQGGGRVMSLLDTHWILCPVCRGKTRTQIREDTVLENFPLFCPKCRRTFLISMRGQKTEYLCQPDAKTQS